MSGQIDGCTILVRSGIYVNPLNLSPADIRIGDIAHALGNQCRFSGHTSRFYSVAEHCVRVARLLDYEGYSREIRLWGLLHDAAEAYLVDLPRPLKRDPVFGAFYRDAEERAMRAVIERFGLTPDEPAAVKHADLTLLATERRDLMPSRGDWAVLDGVEPLPHEIDPMLPSIASSNFAVMYGDLSVRAAA